MFTGIVTDVGEIVSAEGTQGTLMRLRIHSSYDATTITLGASIACGGPCLTVVAFGPRDNGSWFEVDAAAETLARTTLGEWGPGTRVNLERSLKIGDELGGHIVTGHVDGVATIVLRTRITAWDEPWGPTARFDVRAPRSLSRFIAEKGSVCLDGTSLTVNTVQDDVFSVLVIPHTLAVTTWGERDAGHRLNLEVDLMARYAARLAEAGPAG
ncbi:MAG TPA: riboflavin synthase [Microvirga sp.]|nr:riboflavin synthase [Microvirga sp.]